MNIPRRQVKRNSRQAAALSRSKQWTYLLVARNRSRLGLRWLDRAARAYSRAYGNVNYDLHTNGEEEVLRRLATVSSQPVLFDVGANIGEWTLAAKRWMPSAEVHCFEIVRETFEGLRRAVGTISGVVLNPTGLGSAPGYVQVELYPGDSSKSSVVRALGVAEGRSVVTCRVLRGDAYCREAAVDHVHMLKVDTEGYDFDVLSGFSGMLSKGAIDVIQFEYGLWSIWTKRLLVDHYEMLRDHGYHLGKIFPGGVEFRDYQPALDEDFRGPNYLAVHDRRSDLLGLLGIR